MEGGRSVGMPGGRPWAASGGVGRSAREGRTGQGGPMQGKLRTLSLGTRSPDVPPCAVASPSSDMALAKDGCPVFMCQCRLGRLLAAWAAGPGSRSRERIHAAARALVSRTKLRREKGALRDTRVRL